MASAPRQSLGPLVFYAGAVAVTAQSVIARELMASFYGTEFALAAALACWLAFVPLGALVAGMLGRQSQEAARRLLALAVLGLGLAVPAQFFVARLTRPILGVETGAFVSLPGMVLSAALSTAPVSFLVGLLFPSACRWESALLKDGALGIRRVYTTEALGSCFGGALTSFVFLIHQTPAAIAVLCGATWLVAGALWFADLPARGAGRVGLWAAPLALWVCACLVGIRGSALYAAMLAAGACAGFVWLCTTPPKPPAHPWGGLLFALAALTALGYLMVGQKLDELSVRSRWSTFSAFELVENRESRYQNLAVGQRTGLQVLMQNGLRSAVFPDEEAARRAAALLLTQHPHPHKLLVVGGGLGGLCQSIIQSGPFRVDCVEMDPAVIALYLAHLPADLLEPLRTGAVRLYTCDGRYFVQKASSDPARLGRHLFGAGTNGASHPGAPYDIVLINLGNPASASANRFFTLEFFHEVRRLLAPGGTLAVWGITGSEDYLKGPLLAYTGCLYHTLRQVFPQVVIRPGTEFCFFAGDESGPTADPRTLGQRFEQRGLQPAEMRYMFELAEFPPERVRYVHGELEKALSAARLNTDDAPVAHTYFLHVQEHYSRRQQGPGAPPAAASFFQLIFRARPGWFLAPLAACLLAALALRLTKGPEATASCAAGLAIVTTGIFGLSAEMLLIYAYQIHFGYVYRDIGALVGLFMVGLAAGAWGSRHVANSPTGALRALESAQIVLLLALPGLTCLLAASPYLFLLLSPAAGLLTGAEFPLACRIGLEGGHRPSTVAGAFTACDSLGALTGATVTGLILMPAFGLTASAVVLACVKCASLLSLCLAGHGAHRPRACSPYCESAPGSLRGEP